MDPPLEEIYATGTASDAVGNLVNPFPTSIPFEAVAVPYDLVKREGLSRTTELGVACGGKKKALRLEEAGGG